MPKLLTMSLEYIFSFSTLVAISSFVYGAILIQADKPLGWWYKLVNRLVGYDRGRGGERKEPIRILFDPLVNCLCCIAGQTALWSYLYFRWETYHWKEHLMVILVSVFLIDVIQMLWQVLESKKRKD